MAVPYLLPAVFCMLCLSACASLNESDCQQGDWERIGFRDGQRGRPASRIEEHVKACSAYGIAPAELPYRAGRERGLNFYCTPASGLAVGRRGEGYAGVCPEWAESSFLAAYDVGRDIYVARQRLERVEQDQRMIDARLAAARTREEARYWSKLAMRSAIERDLAWMDLRWQEGRAASVR